MANLRTILRSIPRLAVGIVVFCAVALGGIGLVLLNAVTPFFSEPVETIRNTAGRILTPSEAGLEKKKEKMRDVIAAYDEELTTAPAFTPTPDHVVPEERVLTYFRVQHRIYKSVAAEYERFSEKPSDRATSFQKIQFFSEWVPLTMAYSRSLERMPPPEYEWITEELYKAALWGMNWYWENRAHNERVKLMRDTLAMGLEIKDPPKREFGDWIARPDLFDATQVPLQNRRYLLKYKSEFRWQQINFDGLDLSGIDLMDPLPAVGDVTLVEAAPTTTSAQTRFGGP